MSIKRIQQELRNVAAHAPQPALLPSDSIQQFYPIHEAAQIARIHECTIYRWASEGRITLYGHPKTYRVLLSELLPKNDVSQLTNNRSSQIRRTRAIRTGLGGNTPASKRNRAA